MSAQQEAFQALLDWSLQQMKLLQTVIPGTRTITHDPLGAPGERERGAIDATEFDGQEWLGDNVGQVIDLMNDSLGAVDDEAYHIVE